MADLLERVRNLAEGPAALPEWNCIRRVCLLTYRTEW